MVFSNLNIETTKLGGGSHLTVAEALENLADAVNWLGQADLELNRKNQIISASVDARTVEVDKLADRIQGLEERMLKLENFVAKMYFPKSDSMS